MSDFLSRLLAGPEIEIKKVWGIAILRYEKCSKNSIIKNIHILLQNVWNKTK